MSLFEKSDYRSYLRSYLKGLPKNGRGELSKIAVHLRTNSTLLSQVLSGTRNFSAEQTLELSRYLGHSPLETDYFSLLVQIEKAGTHALREHLQAKLGELKGEALKLSKRIAHEKALTDQEKAVFYSSWVYSAVHLATSLKDAGVSPEIIAEKLSLGRSKVLEVLQFLVRAGLVLEKQGLYRMGVKSTFVARGSPHLLRHHSSWRVQAIARSEELREEELMYSGQLSLSVADFQRLREMLADFLGKANEIVRDSPAEELAALNIDLFRIRG